MNLFLITILTISIIFTMQFIEIDAEVLPYTEKDVESNKLPIILDDDFKVEKFVTGLNVPTTIEFLGDDLLVLQKNDGKVRLIRNGVLQTEPVLDVEVSNYGERGLLGITSKDSTVYLFFTEAHHDGGLSLGNHVYAYTWNGEKLVEPRLVKALPGWTTGYNGGVLATDLDKNVYLTSGSQYKFGALQNFLQSESHVCTTGDNPCNSTNNLSFSDSVSNTLSCINVSFHHYTTNPFSYQDHQPDIPVNPWETNLSFVLDNIQSCLKAFMYDNFSSGNWNDTSVILQIEPNSDYVAIGTRNSFGLTVDPITGNLWMTENGPDNYDEINLIPGKSNLGWAKYVGPVDEESVPTVLGYEEYVYKNPEFSWELPIGITGLSFADSEMFKKYSNWLFVTDSTVGNIYKFKLNTERTGFIFSDPNLKDLVVNIDPENRSGYLHEKMDEILFGINFGVVTDLEFGPDGAMYVVSIMDGTIYRITLQ